MANDTEKMQTVTSEDQNHHDIITLEKYLDKQVEALKDTMAATAKSLEVRLEAMNELRDQINRERGHFVTRDSCDPKHCMITDQIRSLEISRAELSGKASVVAVYWTGLFTVLSFVIAALSLIVAFTR